MFRTITALAALTLAACNQTASDAPDLAPETPPPAVEAPTTAAFIHNDYTDTATWLCHPGKTDDACAVDLTATQIDPDGTTTIIPFEAATDPSFDCFYIYPTVSLDPTWNSDMTAGPEELNVVANQFARYGAACRLFAPIYRERTVQELRNLAATGVANANAEMRYADVLGSWQTYMRDHNNGRGVVLIGHSQGAGLIFDMLEKDLLGSPEQAQIIAVHSIGSTETIDPVLGGFKGFPLCEAATDFSCLINYASFRATTPPPASTGFAKAGADTPAICTNPALVSGNDGQLNAYMPTKGLMQPDPYDYGVEVDTPFVTLPGLLSAACQSNDTHDWLAISVHGDPSDPRADDITGDVIIGGQVIADWGLHVIDVNLAMGNLVSLAETQGAAWLAAHEAE